MKLTSKLVLRTLGLLLLASACSKLSPVITENLCTKNPPHEDCEQCRMVPRDARCPQCLGKKPQAGCPNAKDGGAGAGGISGGGGKGGSGSGGDSARGGTSGQSPTGGAGDGSAGSEVAGEGGVDGGATCSLCPNDKPVCLQGACVGCGQDDDCQQTGKRRCEPNEHVCVACVGKTDCGGSKPECDPVKHECVECLGNDHCTSPSRPACEAGECTPCKNNDACTGPNHSGKPLCDMASTSATQGQCVQCITGSDCANPTPQCSSHQCVPCNTDTACTDPAAPECGSNGSCVPCTTDSPCIGRAGTEVCDTAAGATQGRCVQCTGTKYESCKQGSTQYVCDSLNHACSSTAVEHSGDLCSACVSDAQCQAGKLCVKQTFDDPSDSPDQGAIDIGYFCVWHKASGVGGAPAQCSSTPPYVNVGASAVSLDGETADVCVLAVSTCPALADFRNKDCAPGGTPDDSQCGAAGVHDGVCVLKEPGPPQDVYRCTVPCIGNDDCKPGSTCSGSNQCSL